MSKISDTPVPPIITLGQWSECVELAIHERGHRNPVRFMRWWLPDGGDIFNDRAPKTALVDVIQAELAKPLTLCIFTTSPEGYIERWLPGDKAGRRIKRRANKP